MVVLLVPHYIFSTYTNLSSLAVSKGNKDVIISVSLDP